MTEWRLFYDDYERGTAFIARDADSDPIVDDLPYEKVEDIIGAHNADIAAERSATVERIRAAINAEVVFTEWQYADPEDKGLLKMVMHKSVNAILDVEAAR